LRNPSLALPADKAWGEAPKTPSLARPANKTWGEAPKTPSLARPANKTNVSIESTHRGDFPKSLPLTITTRSGRR